MNKFKWLTLVMLPLCLLNSCSKAPSSDTMPTVARAQSVEPEGKVVIYQAFTRLFGNKLTTNKPWGTIAENGVGKFNDFNDEAFLGLKALGVSHLWLTGVPHHALVADYSTVGISADDPDVVKGRAGSPYAVKDYYDVNPDLAVDPAKRMEEFKALLARAHRHGIKVIIDIVPNHVARHYRSTTKPEGVRDFGENDNVAVEYQRDNNFYYVPNQPFELPDYPTGFQALGGRSHPLRDGKFAEFPAKWTGNGARAAKPSFDDWFETVKINYGVKSDGSYDFATLPKAFATKDHAAHRAFWQQQAVPNSWLKFQQITQYWLAMGVDGFRYDMAEMVPVEFWSYLNSEIKATNPEALLLAEVYQPALYRDYLKLGKMDYLYDKVGFYDSLKPLMQGKGTGSAVFAAQQQVQDIAPHMLHFLENHDEQRIASPEFAGDANKGKPAMVVSALISTSPTLLYFGQESGETGALAAGFGQPSRTSIFDYVGVPAHQAWMNGGRFDGGGFTPTQRQLHQFYQKIMQISATQPAVRGDFVSLHQLNLQNAGYSEQQMSFVRFNALQRLIVVSNFSEQPVQFKLQIPADLLQQWQMPTGTVELTDLLQHNQLADVSNQIYSLHYQHGQTGSIHLQLAGLGSVVLSVPIAK